MVAVLMYFLQNIFYCLNPNKAKEVSNYEDNIKFDKSVLLSVLFLALLFYVRLLFFLFTGEAPKREKIKIKNIDCLKGISKEWKDIINHCLKYMPGMRFSSISALKERILMISGQTKTEKSCRMIVLPPPKAAVQSVFLALMVL